MKFIFSYISRKHRVLALYSVRGKELCIKPYNLSRSDSRSVLGSFCLGLNKVLVVYACFVP